MSSIRTAAGTRALRPSKSKARLGAEGIVDEAGEVEGAEAAAAVGRQRLLAAGIGGGDGLQVSKVVLLVDAIDEEHPRVPVTVGAGHQILNQLPGIATAIDPEAIRTPIGPRPLEGPARLGSMHQIDDAARDDGL